MTTPFPFVSGAVLTAAQLNDIQNLPISDKTASYTLLVGDVTKRTIMNSASATTITVDDAIFTVGDVIQVANKGAGTCTLVAGVGVTINTSGSLALAQYGGGYLLCLSASTFTFFNLGGGVSYGTATGGIGAPTAVTISGVDYEYLTFNSTGTLTVTKEGLFDVLVFAGGGGGAASQTGQTRAAGGGGGSSKATATIYLTANQTITVGGGGAGATDDLKGGTIGSVSNVGSVVASLGGGPGGTYASEAGYAGGGGCGGGGWGLEGGNVYVLGGIALLGSNFGNNGGNGVTADAGGGGGGVGAVGGNAVTSTGGNGGAGFDVSAFIGGSALLKSAGGGGGGNTGGTGGSSIGGNGGSNAANGTAAGANTASGGGGAGRGGTDGANGGSGIVYVRFKV
jgi:hypothetical protein